MSTPYTPRTSQLAALDDIMADADKVNGRRRRRKLYFSDAQDLLNLIDEHPDAIAAKSYSRDGFVANAYKYRAEIVYCAAARQIDGSYLISVGVANAKRSFGGGSLLTMNGRALRQEA